MPDHERVRLLATPHNDVPLLTRALEGTGIKPEDAPLYSVLDRMGPLTPKELSHALGIGPSTLTYRLKALEAAGEVVRRRHPDDGRSALLELSKAGRRRWSKTIPEFAEALRRAERRITLPHDDVAEALHAISMAIDEELQSSDEGSRRQTYARDLHRQSEPRR